MKANTFHPRLLGLSNHRGFASRVEHELSNRILIKRMVIGSIGGLLGTFAMGLFGAGLFLSMGLPASLNFSFIGDAAAGFFYTLGLEMTGGISLGVVVYCLIGLGLGLIFVVAVSGIDALQVDSMKKGVGLGILSVEIVSQPLLVAAAILLKMTASDLAQWAGVSFLMHLVYGNVLGAVVIYGLRAATTAKHA